VKISSLAIDRTVKGRLAMLSVHAIAIPRQLYRQSCKLPLMIADIIDIAVLFSILLPHYMIR
jgi:hypothetical protein